MKALRASCIAVALACAWFGCATSKGPDFVADPAVEKDPVLHAYILKMSDQVGASWKKVLIERYRKQLVAARRKHKVIKTRLRVRIAPDGKILDSREDGTSSDDFARDAAIEAFRRTARLPAPPAEVSARLEKGVLWDFEIDP